MSKIEWIKLEDFVKNAIIDIDNALKNSSTETWNTYLFTNWTTDDWKWNIHFDLTVYSENTTGWKSWWEIKVCWLGSIWGQLWFANKKYTTSNIKFSVCRSKES